MRQFWFVFAGVVAPFGLVLLVVGYCHFVPDAAQANSFSHLMHFGPRLDSAFAAGFLVLFEVPFPFLFVAQAWKAWGNLAAGPDEPPAPPPAGQAPPADPPRTRDEAPPLDEPAQQARQDALARALHPQDLSALPLAPGSLADLRSNRNLCYILTRRLAYGDA
jgi:hypothetical protein